MSYNPSSDSVKKLSVPQSSPDVAFKTKFVARLGSSSPRPSQGQHGPTHRALLIPEVVARIGHFIPLYSTYLSSAAFPRLTPKQLLRCTRVCRLWFHVLTPLLWAVVDDSVARMIPMQAIQRNAYRIRSLYRLHNFGWPSYVACTKLTHLTTSSWIVGVDELIRQNPSLERLEWCSKAPHTDISVRVLSAIQQSMGRLRELKLVECTLKLKDLLMILRSMPVLRRLEFEQTTIQSSRDLYTEMFHSAQLNFPNIRHVSLGRGFSECEGLFEILAFCPRLERLDLDSGTTNCDGRLTRKLSAQSTETLATILSRSCPRLRAIEYWTPLESSIQRIHLLSGDQYTSLVKAIHTTPVSEPRTSPKSMAPSRVNNACSSMNGIRKSPVETSGIEPTSATPVSFKADLLELDMSMTVALMDLCHTLETISLRIHVYECQPWRRHEASRWNFKNISCILSACQGLQTFELDFLAFSKADGGFSDTSTASVLTANQGALMLFEDSWRCQGLKRLSISGLHRTFHVNYHSNSWERTEVPQIQYAPIRMKELLQVAETPDLSEIQDEPRSG
ncbi:hypothetical protein BGW38_000354, partial [Lunasporangiospora selenospora]